MNFLTKTQKRNLHRQLKIERDHRHVDRIRIILLLDKNWSYAKIAEVFFIDPKTITNYKNRYLEYGVAGLLNDGYAGRTPLLRNDEKEILKRDLEEHLFKSVLEVVGHVKNRFGVFYSLSGMRYLLLNLGFSFKKAKGVPAKADIEKQRAFIRYYRRLTRRLQNNGDKSLVYFADATHPTHGTSLQRGWIKKGEEFLVKTPSGKFRLNIHGVVCIETLEVIVKMYQTINRFSICDFLEALRKKYSDLNRKNILYLRQCKLLFCK